jgi:valyl-tRNA synthetase
MASGYQPSLLEERHYQRWESAGYFAPSGDGEPYCIVIPPPNVTGTLHMGHALQDTLMDALTRYHRMRGRRVLWQPGTDHAGIATQMVVERLLNAEGSSRLELGRDAFVRRVWDWKERSSSTISQQLRRLGASVDWSRERFTMDPGLSRAVIKVFVQLYREGLLYRGKRLVNWDPVLRTALSDLEVISTEEQGKLWHFRYPFADGDGHLVVATTRPETMLGDTAVAVHPDDERYRDLIGRELILPLTGRCIPVIADTYVDPTFGTGCVKITPAHDFNDYEVGQRHDLALINIFDDQARLNEAVPAAYHGLDRFEARERIVADMSTQGFLDSVKDHTLMVPRGDRSGAVLEPYLTDQWYVRVGPLAQPAITAVATGRIRFVPENWSKTYFEWMHNIQDWCISRQLWWGHRIPAWYDETGQIFVGEDEASVRREHGLGHEITLRQDEDVLDTWFSSALWPFSTMGWPEATPELKQFYPTSVLVTGFDIIFFWVARMIMMGLKFAGDVPFRDVYIHALVRDHDGQKMSKSKGNVLDPLDLIDGVDLDTLLRKRTEGLMQPHLRTQIEKATRKEYPSGIPAFGADAVRFTFASLATTGRDIRFDLPRVDGYHRFCNKLWNAAEFSFLHVLPAEPDIVGRPTIIDRWIYSRLHHTIEAVHTQIGEYRFDLVAQTLYDFTWHEFCDWYLELVKPRIYDPDADPAERRAARDTLAEVLGCLLKLLHPLIPFITEDLWLRLCEKSARTSPTIMRERLPEAATYAADADAEAEITWLKSFVIAIRQVRGEMNISPSVGLAARLVDAAPSDCERARRHEPYLRKLAGLDRIEFVGPDAALAGCATTLLGDTRVLIPLAGLIDLTAERARLRKHRERVEADLEKCRNKLMNARFVDHAPADIVAKERARAQEFEQRAAQLDVQLQRLEALDGAAD